jgi:hypothetical protein
MAGSWRGGMDGYFSYQDKRWELEPSWRPFRDLQDLMVNAVSLRSGDALAGGVLNWPSPFDPRASSWADGLPLSIRGMQALHCMH